MIKALIFDLDDTIYPAKSVADDMYAELFEMLSPHISPDTLQNIRQDILTTPFQTVADRYTLDKELKDAGLNLCLGMDYNGPMKTFPDYSLIKEIDAEKFLVTAGYTKLQKSKIDLLGIAHDFKEIIIADPDKSDLSKADVFEQIMNNYQYDKGELLVIGDNPESEIASAKELGIATYLYDYEGKYSPALADHYGTSYHNIKSILSEYIFSE